MLQLPSWIVSGSLYVRFDFNCHSSFFYGDRLHLICLAFFSVIFCSGWNRASDKDMGSIRLFQWRFFLHDKCQAAVKGDSEILLLSHHGLWLEPIASFKKWWQITNWRQTDFFSLHLKISTNYFWSIFFLFSFFFYLSDFVSNVILFPLIITILFPFCLSWSSHG